MHIEYQYKIGSSVLVMLKLKLLYLVNHEEMLPLIARAGNPLVPGNAKIQINSIDE